MTAKNMRSLAIAGFVFSFAAGAWAQDLSVYTKCKALDFSEMTSMSQAELTKLYCDNKKKVIDNKDYMDIYNKSANNFISIGAFDKVKESQDQANKHFTNMDFCSSENERVLRALKKVSPKASTPTCS